MATVQDEEIIPDGGRVRVSVMMMDSRRPATYVEDRDSPDGALRAHRAASDAAMLDGLRRGSNGRCGALDAVQGARDAARAMYVNDLNDAWRGEDRLQAPELPQEQAGQGEDAREQYKRELSNAYKKRG